MEEASKQVIINFNDNVSSNVHRLFPSLTGVGSTLTTCKFVLEYSEKVRLASALSNEIEEEFNNYFEGRLSQSNDLLSTGTNNERIDVSTKMSSIEEDLSALQKNTTPIQAVDSYSTPLDSAQLQPHKTVVPSNEMVESRLPCGRLVTIKLPEGSLNSASKSSDHKTTKVEPEASWSSNANENIASDQPDTSQNSNNLLDNSSGKMIFTSSSVISPQHTEASVPHIDDKLSTGLSAKNASASKSSISTHEAEQVTSTSLDPSKNGHNTKPSERKGYKDHSDFSVSVKSNKQLGQKSKMSEKLNSTWIERLHNYLHPTTAEGTDSCAKDSGGKLEDNTLIRYIYSFEHCEYHCEGCDLCKQCSIYWAYIEHHLMEDIKYENKVCNLWKLCLRKKCYGIFEFAPERMILFSDNKDKIGTITNDYDKYRINPGIGMGGFGRVFEHSVSTGTKVAVKEEAKPASLISNLKRFTSLLDLNHPNVLHFQEYIIGHHRTDKDELTLLLVMEHYEQRGLNEPFKKDHKCLLDYMSLAPKNANYFFRNLLVISLDLFNALKYFSEKHLVHRDVKRKYGNKVETVT